MACCVPAGDEIRIAGLHRNVRQQIFHGVVRKGPEKLLLVHAGFQPDKNFRAALRPDQMPHLGFSAAAGCLLVLCGVGIVGMHLDGPLVVGKNKFDEHREFSNGGKPPAAPICRHGVPHLAQRFSGKRALETRESNAVSHASPRGSFRLTFSGYHGASERRPPILGLKKLI